MDTLQQIVIDATSFIQGVSLDNYTSDAGYSPLSKGFNHIKERGVLNMQPGVTDLTSLSAMDGTVIASIADPNYISNAAYLLTSAGSLYTLNGTLSAAGLTSRQTDSTIGHNYTFGTSDMVWYKGGLYCTCDIDIMYVTGADLTASVDKSWWVTTKGKAALGSAYRHPMEVVEDRLYIADINNIHTWDGTTAVYGDIVLPPNFNITALHKHPNGRDLIAFCAETVGYSNTYQSKGAAFIINTVTGEFTQQTTIDDQVEGAKLVGGILYVTYANKLGYFTDTGIVFLRDLNFTLPFSGEDLGYRHHLGNLEGHLLVVENESILAFGDLGAGKVWWYPTISFYGQKIKNALYLGSKKLIYQSADQAAHKNLYLQDFSLAATTGAQPNFYTNKYDLPRKAWIRRVEIEHETYTTNNGIVVSAVDPNGTQTVLGSNSYSAQGAIGFTRIDCNYYTGMIQLAILSQNRNLGIKKVTIYYEFGEI